MCFHSLYQPVSAVVVVVVVAGVAGVPVCDCQKHLRTSAVVAGEAQNGAVVMHTGNVKFQINS